MSGFPSFTHPGLQHFRYGWRYASDPTRSFLRVLTSRILERAMLSHRGYRVLLRLESGRPSRTPLELLFEDQLVDVIHDTVSCDVNQGFPQETQGDGGSLPSIPPNGKLSPATDSRTKFCGRGFPASTVWNFLWAEQRGRSPDLSNLAWRG